MGRGSCRLFRWCDRRDGLDSGWRREEHGGTGATPAPLPPSLSPRWRWWSYLGATRCMAKDRISIMKDALARALVCQQVEAIARGYHAQTSRPSAVGPRGHLSQ